MKKEIADKWVADLRTNPPQCKRFLYDGKGYCCLGRLCLILGAKFKKDENNFFYPVLPNDEDMASPAIISKHLMAAAGMKTNNGTLLKTSLTELNDNGNTFFQIADVIEKNWEKL
jgi:hypothetical protein